MDITIKRETLLKPLQMVSGAVEKRQTLPVLSHVLLIVKDQRLSVVATDLELELVGYVTLAEPCSACEITVPARKLIDICRSLSDGVEIKLFLDKNRLIIRSGRSRFALTTLPASEFPRISEIRPQLDFTLSQSELKRLLTDTAFAMAHQDVRYYLNGMLFDLNNGELKVVATDGHRLALSSLTNPVQAKKSSQVIVPRKGVMEMLRLLDESDDPVKVVIGLNNFQAKTENFTFTSKLVDGKFPDFNRVIPKNNDKLVTIDQEALRQALARAAILCNEKFHGVRLLFNNNLLKILANNPDQEEAEEELEIGYQYEGLEVGFNVVYLLDAVTSLKKGPITLTLRDSNSSTLVEHAGDKSNCLYVVMPMRL